MFSTESRKKTSYLQVRNGRYHLRYRIPSDLSSLIPQGEIVKSLKTTSLKTAKETSYQYLLGISQTFSLLRSRFISSEQAQERLYGLLDLPGMGTPRRPGKAACKGNTEALTLSKVICTFTRDKEQEWTAKTKMESAGVFRIIVDLMGDVAVETIDRTQVRDLRDKLMKLPPNVYKGYPKLSLLDVLHQIDAGKLAATPMSLTSVNKHIQKFSTLMLYCVKEGLRPDNPAVGLSVKQRRRPDEERKAYDMEDIKKIKANLVKDEGKPERFWVPMICMYSGLRLDEACQLYKDDITKVDGVWCINVNDSKDKKLKNLSSKRIIPIHPALLAMGLIEHAELCKDGERLWDNLTWCKVNGYSNSLGKWYQRFNRKHVTADPLKCFHSLRHTFADTLKQLGVQESLISELMGHANDSITTGRYGKRYQPQVLLDAICELNYPDPRFS